MPNWLPYVSSPASQPRQFNRVIDELLAFFMISGSHLLYEILMQKQEKKIIKPNDSSVFSLSGKNVPFTR